MGSECVSIWRRTAAVDGSASTMRRPMTATTTQLTRIMAQSASATARGPPPLTATTVTIPSCTALVATSIRPSRPVR